MQTYKSIIEIFKEAADKHLGISSFNTGTLDFLNAQSVNVAYPHMFLRPLTSPGIVSNSMNGSAIRRLNFELYILDNVRLENESPVDIISRLERVGYDVCSYFNYGPYQQEVEAIISNVTPVNEAFKDRTHGWLLNLTITFPGQFSYCDAPFV
jgi:hypothetical protein